MDFGSVKNVGVAVVDAIVNERKRNGNFESFTDFCERMSGEAVNRKCIESLIKAGAFDEFGITRATLLASFENILETINNQEKKSMKGQVTIFDIGAEDESLNKNKYTYTELEEFSEKECLSMEKEMLGIYISGHPLDKLREKIKKIATIDTLKLLNINEENDFSQDGKTVKYVGIITSVKKKYTRNNTIMAFVTIEDLYGSCEIIVFDSCFNRSSSILLEENIVVVEGRLSIKEDEQAKIVANKIVPIEEFAEEVQNSKNKSILIQKPEVLNLNITDLDEDKKEKLRGMIRFFAGDKNNIKLQVMVGEEIRPCGAIYLTETILKQFEDLLGKDRIILKNS